MKTDTPTPRKDKEHDRINDDEESGPVDSLIEALDFARQLERGLAEANQQLHALEKSVMDLTHPNCRMLLRERDQWREVAEGLAKDLKYWGHSALSLAAFEKLKGQK